MNKEIIEAVKNIKSAILKSQSQIALNGNRIQLSLYFGIGKYISENTRNNYWGTGSIENISSQLQKEMPGLRGFSTTNLKNMRTFFEEWNDELNRQSLTDDLQQLFNRELNCLVAVELKMGKFKTAYLGQLNGYLQVLDDTVRKPHENQSIGIILCQDAKKDFVEYAIRDYTKPIGVATYKTLDEMPEKYRKVLPDLSEMRKLLGGEQK